MPSLAPTLGEREHRLIERLARLTDADWEHGFEEALHLWFAGKLDRSSIVRWFRVCRSWLIDLHAHKDEIGQLYRQARQLASLPHAERDQPRLARIIDRLRDLQADEARSMRDAWMATRPLDPIASQAAIQRARELLDASADTTPDHGAPLEAP